MKKNLINIIKNIVLIGGLITNPNIESSTHKPPFVCNDLKNPTYKELKEFLYWDKTELNEYKPPNNKLNIPEYGCYHFAWELRCNAIKERIRASLVYLCFAPKTHAHVINGFETTDKGLIFIDPQNDREIKIEIGESYHKQNSEKNEWPIDDTIRRATIIWPDKSRYVLD